MWNLSNKLEKDDLDYDLIRKTVDKYKDVWVELDPEKRILAEKLVMLTEYAGGRAKAADIMDVAPTTVDNYRAGKTQPKILELLKLLNAAHHPVDYVLQGTEYYHLVTSPDDDDVGNHDFIPKYDIQAMGGNGSFELAPKILSYVTFDKTWFEKYAPPNSVLHAIDVNGDSMAPTLNAGDMVIVNTNTVSIEDALSQGGIFVLSVRGDFKVKRLQPMIDGSLRMISDNPRYQDEIIPKDVLESDVYIQGHVIWVGGPPK